MQELLQYGLQPKSESKCLLPTTNPPPVLYFAEGLDCLFAKINVVLQQELGSLFYDRQLGSTIPEFIFEDDTDASISALKEAIYESLTRSIDNLTIDSIDIERKETLNGIEYIAYVSIIYESDTYNLTLNVSKSGITVQEG